MSPPPSKVDNDGMPKVIGSGFEIIVIKELTEMKKQFTMLIIGELGAGDGLEGCHNYLFCNKNISTSILFIDEIDDYVKIDILNKEFYRRRTKMIYLITSNY